MLKATPVSKDAPARIRNDKVTEEPTDVSPTLSLSMNMQQDRVDYSVCNNVSSRSTQLQLPLKGTNSEQTSGVSNDVSPVINDVMSVLEKRLDDIVSHFDGQIDQKIYLLERQLKDCMQKELSIKFVRLKGALTARSSLVKRSNSESRAGLKRQHTKSTQIRKWHTWHSETAMPTISEELQVRARSCEREPQAITPEREEHVPQPSTLPLTEPDRDVILWLSENVVDWKFFARYLRLEDKDIERIEKEHANDMREQCYAMLRQWSRQANVCNYRTLGTALSRDGKNCYLYSQFVKEISKHEPVEETSTDK